MSGYHCKNNWVANAIAVENLQKPLISERIAGLRKRLEDETVAGPLERRQRLTEVVRAKLTDFMELGQDGSWVNIGKETAGAGAIQEIHSRTEYDDDGSKPTVHTSVKLHSLTQAIDLLNKMDKIYSDQAGSVTNNVQFNIIVLNDKTRELVGKIMSGERLT